jgi:hypothetical protein
LNVRSKILITDGLCVICFLVELYCRGVYKDDTDKLAYLSPRTIAPEDSRFNEYSYPGTSLVWPGEFVFGYTTPNPENPSNPCK